MRYKLRPGRLAGAKGFTIIELMIALSVLAVLLLISALTLMRLGYIYVKGNNQANVQNSARNIVNDLSSQLMLGGAVPDLSHEAQGYFCIGTTRYNFVIGKQVNSSPTGYQTEHALWRDTMQSAGSCPPLSLASPSPSDGLTVPGSGQELVPQNMRLTEFSIKPITNSAGFYEVTVGVAYGDDDLLCVRGASLGGGSDCDSSQISANPNGHARNLQNPSGQVGCIGNVGQQFCAVSDLNISVARRLQAG